MSDAHDDGTRGVERELDALAAEASQRLEAARGDVRAGDRELVRNAFERAAASDAPTRAPRAVGLRWWALAAAVALACALVWLATSQRGDERRWLSQPSEVRQIQLDDGSPALVFERPPPSAGHYRVHIYAGPRDELVCDEAVRGTTWKLPDVARAALERERELTAVIETVDDSGATPPAPLRLRLSLP